MKVKNNRNPLKDIQNTPSAGTNNKNTKAGASTNKSATATATFIHNGQSFFTHPDNHGKKHLVFSPTSNKKLIESTVGGPAKFDPNYIGSQANYQAILANSIRLWARKGAKNPSVVDMGTHVGYDRGQPTTKIEIYYGGSIGSHIRPKA